jgi:hypothetical protein
MAGATDPVLEIPGAVQANAGSYACIASNSAGTVTSASATLAVASSPNPGYLINLSARADVGTGNNILIGGFGVAGSGSKQLLVRGVGPALSAFFNTELAAPQLVLLDNGGAIVATNIGWGNAPVAGPSTASEAADGPATGALFQPMLVAMIAPPLSSMTSCGTASSLVKKAERVGPTPRTSNCLVPVPVTPKPPIRMLLPVPTAARAERLMR